MLQKRTKEKILNFCSESEMINSLNETASKLEFYERVVVEQLAIYVKSIFNIKVDVYNDLHEYKMIAEDHAEIYKTVLKTYNCRYLTLMLEVLESNLKYVEENANY